MSRLARWARSRSLWPILFQGTGCPPDLQAIVDDELGVASITTPRNSPRQGDLLIVAGAVPIKLLPVVQRVWQQMAEPKWCLALGCGPSPDLPDTYALVPDLGRLLPVDVSIDGFPPSAEALREGLTRIRALIQRGDS